MTEHRSKPYDELPDWEKKLRRDREAKRKAAAKQKRTQDRLRFKIGERVGLAFPELMQVCLSEDSVELQKLDAALAYLKAHQEVLQPHDNVGQHRRAYTK